MTSHRDVTEARTADTAEGATLGAMLRHAREQRNLSVNDLAACLRLEPRIIERLEGNQFDSLPAPAFIRGYVRSIAKQLEIDSAPLIAVFNLRFDDDAPSLSDFESRAPVQITSDSNVIRYTTVGLCIVMLLMVALWWQAHDFGLPDFAAGEATDSPATAPLPATPPLPYSFTLVEHPADPFYRAPEPPPMSPEERAAEESFAAANPPETVAPASPTADIFIVTRADAWIEIRDATGRRLHYSIAKPGNEIRIDGERPYAVVIGNAPAVSLEFEGTPFEIARHAEDGIARFSLGQDDPSPSETASE